MLVIGTKSNNADPRQTICSLLWIMAAILCCGMSHATTAAQVPGVTAKVARVTPGALVYSGGAAVALRKGNMLQPGDVIDTRASGRVVIDLGDGSQVVIYPGSRVELKNFQAGAGWRDLLAVTLGRIRATINHHGKRPNPYRVYSPVASIAVRGTVFLVTVEASGETRVFVYEGLVEVGSLVNPQNRVLVRPGRNIIVRRDGDISMAAPVPGGIGGDQMRDVYNGADLRSSRFVAFNDSYLDSLRNPAYATEFRQPGARFYLTPYFSPKIESAYRYGANDDDTYGNSSANSPNYTLSSQASSFIPLGSRIVVGAGAAVAKTDIGSDAAENYFNRLNQTTVYKRYENNAEFTSASLSLIAARRFGQAGRTSFGLKFDYLAGRRSISINSETSESRNFEPALEEYKARGRRAGLSVGVTQDVGDDKKLGIYYRYSLGSVENGHSASGFWGVINNDPYFFNGGKDFRTQPGHSSEIGILFRGSVTRRLFYGVDSSILFEQDQVENHRPLPTTIGDITYISTQTYLNKRRARQGIIGVGIGYALRPRAVVSLDLSIGRSQENYLGQTHFSSLPPGLSYSASDSYASKRASFRAWHIGGQTDIWRNFYVGASRLFFNDSNGSADWGVFQGQTYSFQQHSFEWESKLSNLNLGWRMTPSWIVQYTYFNSQGGYTPSHTIMFRYEFGRREER
jgi:hypothetical protein